MNHTLDAAAWDDFRRESWQRSPRVLGLESPPLAPREVVGALTSAGRMTLERKLPISSWRYYVDKIMKYSGSQISRLLPHPAQNSLRDCVSETREKLGGTPFVAILDSPQTVLPDAWLNLRPFIAGLYESTGFPVEGPELEIAFGDAPDGLLGPHFDPAYVFTFPIEGELLLRTWTAAEWRSKPHHPRDPRSYEGSGLEFEAKPGTALYRPAGLYSMMECRGPALWLTVSFSKARSLTAQSLLSQELRAVAGVGGEGAWPGGCPSGCRDVADQTSLIPAGLLEDLARIRRASWSDRLDDRLKAAWAERITGLGFANPPALRESRRVEGRDRVLESPGHLTMGLPAGGDGMIVASNGHSRRIEGISDLRPILACTRSGDAVPVDAIRERCAPVAPEALDEVIEFLIGARTFDLADQEGRNAR